MVVLIVVIITINNKVVLAQPNYQQQTQISTSNFYTLQSDFYNWQSNQTGSSEVTRAAKKFGGFEAFWKNRVVNNSTITGSFSEYSSAALLEWSSPRCTSADESRWEPIGPFPKGNHNMGMIKALWNDPNDQNFIIVGSGRNSGIFRSVNGGNTWDDVLISQKIPALGINSFAVSPNKNNNKRVIYAGTGEANFSIGIIKSIDDGLTWNTIDAFPFYNNASTSLNPNYKVRKVIVPQNLNSTQQDIVYAIARNSFFKSITGGNTWVTPYSFGNNIGEAIDMEVVSTDYNKIFVSTNCIYNYSNGANHFDYPAKLMYSINGGNSWNDITTNIAGNIDYNSIHIEITPNGTLYVHYSIWGGGATIKKSTNNGSTWTAVYVPKGNTTVPIIARGLYGNESFAVSPNTDSIYQGNAYPW